MRSFFQTFERPPDWWKPGQPEGTRLYIVSYLLTRMAVGILGILLPLVLTLIDAFLLDAPITARGSISAYYHSPARDFFVGTLCVIGVLLITYMAGKWNFDFLMSAVAGIAVIGVAMFPTDRPDLAPGAAKCGAAPDLPGCTTLQNRLGEALCAQIHYTSATIFLVSLVALSFVFALRERTVWLRVVHFAASGLIAGALLLIVAGMLLDFSFGSLSTLYVGEVIAVLAFGISWLVKGIELRKVLVPARA
jgi:hypothetical protein